MMEQACLGVVVVVDDEADILELIHELLEGRGYHVVSAADGISALEVLRSTPRVCLVIVDLFMPRMDGFALMREMAADPKLAPLHVCVSTSAPHKVPAGVECLPKPVDVDRLFRLVNEHCR